MAWEICDGGRLAAMLLNEVTSKKPTKQKKKHLTLGQGSRKTEV